MIEKNKFVPGGESREQSQNENITIKELSEKEFAELANKTLREFGINVIKTFYQTVKEGRSKEILGTVAQRGDETEIALESNIEHMFVGACASGKLPVHIIGEHYDYQSHGEGNQEIKHVAFVDAIDDTREYEQGGNNHQGLPAPLWSVASIYSLDEKPVAGVIANLKEKKVYLAADGKNTLLDIETGEEKEIKPSERTSIKDKDFCLATYWGTPKYFVSFAENLLTVEKELAEHGNNAVNQPHSGCFIYGPMAEGLVDAYLITSEPVSERQPGWVFAQNAGLKAYSVNSETGEYYEIVPDLDQINDDSTIYRKAKMPMYLVVKSEQVRDELISLIKKGFQEKEDRKLKDEFVDDRRGEFEIFKASKQTKATNV
jgi:fructose-1,6-bisphosphatase/inositol monophosphatase family enzyme